MKSLSRFLVALKTIWLVLLSSIAALVRSLFRATSSSLETRAALSLTKRRLPWTEVATWLQVVLGLVAIVVSLVALHLSTVSYRDARRSAEKQEGLLLQQQNALDASREALVAVVREVTEQRDLLNTSATKLSEMATVVQQQRQEELRRAARKPELRIWVGALPAERLLRTEPINAVAENNEIKFDVFIANVGDAPLNDPLFRALAAPESVALSHRGMHTPSDGQYKNILMLSAANTTTKQLLPFSAVTKPYVFPFDAIVPQDLADFKLVIEVLGSNSSIEVRRLDIRVMRQQQP